MIFIVILSALAMSLATVSDSNVQIASNQVRADRARACAESGLQVMRYWFNQLAVSGTVPSDQRLSTFATAFQTLLADEGVTNLSPSYGAGCLTIPNVTLNGTGEVFRSTVTQVGTDTLQLDVTGSCGDVSKTVRVNYLFQTRAHSAFDFGIATRGPLDVRGSVEIDDVNIMVTSNTYIESLDDPIGLTVGNAAVNIEGDISIANPIATPDVHSGATIGGVTGAAAWSHIHIGVPIADFPEPDTSEFENAVTLTTLVPSTNHKDLGTHDYSDAVSLENIRIPANYNPTFNAGATLRGVVFIETPNVVHFAGGASVTGVIVGDGDWTDDSATNQILFRGTTDAYSVSDLTGSQFDTLKTLPGTFVLAPGFSLDFGGTFRSASGAIAGNGISLQGNAGLAVRGSVINYANNTMHVQGNGAIHFNRSGLSSVPAGFVPQLVLIYQPASYNELVQ